MRKNEIFKNFYCNKTSLKQKTIDFIMNLFQKPFNTYQHDDKVRWMDKYVFSKLGRKAKYYTKFTTHGLPKPKTAERILSRKLTKNDVLLDDWNGNLIP